MFGRCCVAKDLFQRLAVWMHSGRQPKRGTAEVGRDVRRAVVETVVCPLASTEGHSAEIVVRRGPRESRKWVCEECGDDRCDSMRHLIGRGAAYLSRRTIHIFLLKQSTSPN